MASLWRRGAWWWVRAGLIAAPVLAVMAAAWPGLTPAPVATIVPAATTVSVTVPASGNGAPAQVPPPPGPGVPAPPAQAPDQDASCTPWDVNACVANAVDEVMHRAVTGVVNPAAQMLGETLLSTPSLTELPRIAELWGMSWRLALAAYATVILVGGLIIMSYQTVQTRSTAREVLPRLLVGLVAGVVSLPLCAMAIDIANAVSRSVMGEGVDPVTGADGLRELLTRLLSDPTNQLGFLMVALAVAVALIAVLCGWIARVAVLICLIAAAPLALMWHALPQTESVARWWWRAVAGCLLMQIVQSLALIVGLRILLSPGQNSPGIFGPQLDTSSGLPSMLVLLVLLWILWRIPGWVWQNWVGGSKLGIGSLATSLLKIGLAIKTGGLLAGALSGIGVGKKSRSARPAGPPTLAQGTAGTDADPGGDQLALPIRAARVPKSAAASRLKPQSPWITYHPSLRGKIAPNYVGNRFAEHTPDPRPKHGGAEGQLGLPLAEGLWPEQRPTQDSGGQWRWPIEAPHVPQSRAGTALRPGSPWITYHPSLRGKIAPNYVGNRFAAPRPGSPWGAEPRRVARGQTELPLDSPGAGEQAQMALPIHPIRVAPDRVFPQWSPERVSDLAPREPWAGGHLPGDGQRPIRGISAARMPRERLAHRFVPEPGRPHPADLGQIPPDHLPHPLPRTPRSRLRWTPPPAPRVRRRPEES